MNRLKRFLFSGVPAAAALLLASPAPAQSDAEHTIDAIFQSFDQNRDGVINAEEANHFIDKTFAEMDRGKTGKVSLNAWLNFSFGLADIAADQGRSDAYDRAKAKVFKRWDRSKSGALSLEDYRAGVLGDARAAALRKAKPGEISLDLAAFKRTPFLRDIMRSLR